MCVECIYSSAPQDIRARHANSPAFDVSVDNALEERLSQSFATLDTPQKKLVDQLCTLYLQHTSSDIARESLERLLVQVSGLIDDTKKWEETFKIDYLLDGRLLVLQGDRKRRRVDVGLQNALASQVVSSGKASTTGAFLRAHNALYSPSHCLRFKAKLACSHIAAGWLYFSKTIHLSLACDGVRCGSPAADVLVTFVEDVEHLGSTWLLPMVSLLLQVLEISIVVSVYACLTQRYNEL